MKSPSARKKLIKVFSFLSGAAEQNAAVQILCNSPKCRKSGLKQNNKVIKN
jgi:hypothetical protein